MPKLIEYPRASFQRVLEMANAVDYLGGRCSVQSCADRLSVKVTGALTALIGAAKKHNVIESRNDFLTTTEIYKKIKLAYDDNEKRQNLRIAFLAPQTYSKVYDKFKGRELPVQMLSKLLIREFGVEDDAAQRISNYFIEGAKSCELLIDNKLIDVSISQADLPTVDDTESDTAVDTYNNSPIKQNLNISKNESPYISASDDSYVVHIYGPGMNSKLSISEDEDLIILDAMISKLKKRMKE